MSTLIDTACEDSALTASLRAGLARVVSVFDGHLGSELECVTELTALVERYRGKMLRPTLTLLAGLASGSRGLTREHEVLAAVAEMIHMATLVHDDVLDEAETRRRGRTVCALHGNETAVILGDYLISSSFHLCSTLGKPEWSERIGAVTTTLCEGELLQLVNRGNVALREETYFDIIRMKTGSLIGLACELGALASGAAAAEVEALGAYGREVGAAFQIQDDLLDLLGDEATVGKSVRKDQEKGKLTLPLIRHLARTAEPGRDGEAYGAFSAAADPAEHAALVARMREDGSIESARDTALGLVERARGRLEALPECPARQMLDAMALAAVSRAF